MINDIFVAIIFDNKIRPDTTGIYFKMALENLGYRVEHYNSEYYLTDSIEDKYDFYLCIDDGIDQNMPIRKYKSGVTAFYAIDTHLSFDSKFKKAHRYDFVFCAQKDGAEKMKVKGVNAFWVPLGFDEEIINKHEVEKIYDLSFVGNINIMPERKKLAKRYEKKYKTFIGKAPYYEISKIYSQSKIVINWPIKNDINMRFFEALGSGAFLLSKKVINGEEEIAEAGLHYVNFSNWWDLDRKISFYLKNTELREKIAKSGYNIAIIKNFTYRNRVDLILDIIGFKEESVCPKRSAILPSEKNSVKDEIIIQNHKKANYYEHKRDEMLIFIPSNIRKILDIGCGCGNFGSILKSKLNAEVWGIEVCKTAGESARKKLDNILIADIENNDISLPHKYFDCIIFNDILEHLKDPWIVLRKIAVCLKDEGYIVASIPNIRYFYNMKPLLELKEWRYRDAGILDKNHLRFFTEQTIRDLFQECRFKIIKIEGINHIIFPWKFRFLNWIMNNKFEDMRFPQFACVARKITTNNE